MLIRNVMTVPAITVTAQTSISTALRLMHQEQVAAIPVVDDHGALTGVLCETDLATARVRGSGPRPPRCVGDLPAHGVVAVRPDEQIEAAIDVMRQTRVTNLPVVANDRVVGTVSHNDLTEFLTEHSVHPEVSAGTTCPHSVVKYVVQQPSA